MLAVKVSIFFLANRVCKICYIFFISATGCNSLPYATADFESGTNGLSGYTDDTNDDFDWTRQTGGTLTVGTGPSRDHTYADTSVLCGGTNNSPQGDHYASVPSCLVHAVEKLAFLLQQNA